LYIFGQKFDFFKIKKYEIEILKII